MWQPALIAPHYGNECQVDILYHNAAILVAFPPWTMRHCERMSSEWSAAAMSRRETAFEEEEDEDQEDGI